MWLGLDPVAIVVEDSIVQVVTQATSADPLISNLIPGTAYQESNIVIRFGTLSGALLESDEVALLTQIGE